MFLKFVLLVSINNCGNYWKCDQWQAPGVSHIVYTSPQMKKNLEISRIQVSNDRKLPDFFVKYVVDIYISINTYMYRGMAAQMNPH